MRSLPFLLIAGFVLVLMAGEAEAETSDDFNEVNLYFYGDLDNGNGNISTRMPTSDTDTQSDCPQEGNRLSWPGQDRQWQDVGTWEIEMQTPGEVASGDYTFTIWANSTQGTVEDVQFRIAIYIGDSGGVMETSQSKTVTDSSEVATRFDIAFDIENESFNYDDKIEILLKYSGGDPGENPTTGGDSTEQIVVLTSSIEHPAGIGDFSINHYMASFPEIVVEEFSERVFVKTQVQSAFGVSDIDSNDWTLGVYGLSSGNQGLTADFSMKSLNNDTHEVSFYWYYNQDLAISDTYHFFIQITDIQDNSWEVMSNENVILLKDPSVNITCGEGGYPGEELLFSASGKSAYHDGSIVRYEWDFEGDGVFDYVGFSFATHTFSAGLFSVTIKVRDSDGLEAIDSCEIRINAPPTAIIETSGKFEKDAMISFNGTGSDNDNQTLTYSWFSSIDGNLSIEETFSTKNLSLGSHMITFIVTDSLGDSAVDQTSVFVCYCTPVAIAGEDVKIESGSIVQFSGAATDKDGTITKYEWDFDGDGVYEWSSSDNGRTTNIYNREGMYKATLKVTDNEGFTATDSRMITVSEEDEDGIPSVSLISSIAAIGIIALRRRY